MKKKNNLFWNSILGLTIIACIVAFVLHYKNYSSIDASNFKIYSGIYRQNIPLSALDSISWVERLPEMERRNGFSWLAKEKGVFNDSLTQTKTYVFIDDLRHKKIRLVHHDSLKIYVNFTDSLKTQQLYQKIISLSTKN
jgi:hypothetical protein